MSEGNGPQSASQHVAGESLPDPTRKPVRRDAQRNRDRVLDAAAALVAARGFSSISMDDVALQAGVGKGTVFRAFGDRAGLAAALLDQHERALQERILSGPPPLGFGAQPTARLQAFIDAYAEFLETTSEILVEAENATIGARYRTGVYSFWIAHVRSQLALANPDIDAEAIAHAVLAPLASDLHAHLRHEAGYSIERYRLAAQWQAQAATAAPPTRHRRG